MEFEPLNPGSTEIAVINSLIRKEEAELYSQVAMMIRAMKELSEDLGLDIKFPDTLPINAETFRHDTHREQPDRSNGLWVRGHVRRYAKNVSEICAEIAKADGFIGDLTRLKLRLFGDADFHGGKADLEAIEKAKQEGAAARCLPRDAYS